MNPADVAQGVVAPVQGAGFSFFELFMQAGLVVKLVMTGLGLASVWSWAIIVEKLFAFRKARIESDKFEQLFWSGQSLDELYAGLSRGRTITMSALFVAAMREWKRSVEGNIRALGGIQLRVEKVMDVTISREMERLDRRLLFLATVGSAAPFVGLFGTVWGIMTSFQAIAVSKNTNLSVVAPGIAEALFATALGLMAAIPAVIFYNKFSADSSAISQRLYAFSDEFAAIVSRQIDVMLVLLIIFMVAAPMLQTGVQVELPEAKGTQLPQPKSDPLAVTVKANGDAFIGESPVALEEISTKLKAIAKNGYDEPIYVRGDKGVPYGVVMRVMSRINAGGFKKLSFVLDEEKGG